VWRVRKLVELATTFSRAGNDEKAGQYLDKADDMLGEIEQEQ
jgi:hypothetical protein